MLLTNWSVVKSIKHPCVHTRAVRVASDTTGGNKDWMGVLLYRSVYDICTMLYRDHKLVPVVESVTSQQLGCSRMLLQWPALTRQWGIGRQVSSAWHDAWWCCVICHACITAYVKSEEKKNPGCRFRPVPHQNFFYPSYRIFGHMYKTLNVNKK